MRGHSLQRFASPRLTRVFGAGRAVVLKYHSVLAAPDPMRPGETTAEEFDAQMAVVAASFRNQTLGEFMDSRRAAPTENTVVVTFDDGYKDNHDVALPIMKKHGIRATMFVATGYLDGEAMWNDRLIEAMRVSVGCTVDLADAGLGAVAIDTLETAGRTAQRVLSAIKRLPQQQRAEFVDRFVRASGGRSEKRVMMNAAEVAALANAGMEVGAHTVTHPILSTLSPEESWNEITSSKQALERIVGQEVRTFAYPNGRPDKDFTDGDVQLVMKAGFIGAVTTEWGCATRKSNAFRIPRQGIWGKSRTKLWLQLMRNFGA
jgi:peptidoglycan/xylan/chitin deacetylase (PgdA/CDA1 family)